MLLANSRHKSRVELGSAVRLAMGCHHGRALYIQYLQPSSEGWVGNSSGVLFRERAIHHVQEEHSISVFDGP